jgi:serine/threonine protein kinase
MPPPEPDPSLEALIQAALDAYERSDLAALDELFAAHPDRRGELERALERLRDAGLLGDQSEEFTIPERLGDFRLEGRIGAGGMGVVYRAQELSLGRAVALKVLRPELLFFSGNRRRFRREIEAAARLSHPGIAAIYSFGEELGLPYYAMELLSGATLAELLADLAGQPRSALSGADLWAALERRVGQSAGMPPLYSGSYAATIGRCLLAVAKALAHAHERRVVHRDIKPSNVMLCLDGRVLLLDFGLAAAPGADRLTRTGSQIGSLPYMAPEQVRGGGDQVGPSSDLYGLGVTLYEGLTGVSPYLDPGSAERTLQRVLEGRPAPLRQLAPGLQRDLEVVCLKAFEAESARRYASAGAFAADLEAALEGRPIVARPPSPLEKGLRWVRREPMRALAIALAALLLLGAPLGFGLLQARQNRALSGLNRQLEAALEDSRQKRAELSDLNRQLEGALGEARRQREQAEVSFDAALGSIDGMLRRVGSDVLADVPRFERVRAELLEDALELDLELARLRPEDPRPAAAIDATRLQLADVLLRIGDYAGVCAQAEALVLSLGAGPGESAQRLERSGQARMLWAEAERQLGHVPAALEQARGGIAAFRSALELSEGGDAERSELLHALGWQLSQAALFERWAGKPEVAHEMLEEGIAILRMEVAQRPAERLRGFALAKALGTRALWRYEGGDLPGAIEFQREAVAAWEALDRDHPGYSVTRLQLFSALGNLGDMLGEAGDLEAAGPLVERAVALGQELVRAFPETPRFRANLATALVQHAAWHLGHQRFEPALSDLRRGSDLMEALVGAHPESSEYLTSLATINFNVCVLLRGLSRPEEARERLRFVLDLLKLSLEKLPGDRTLEQLTKSAQALLEALADEPNGGAGESPAAPAPESAGVPRR